MEQSIKYSNPRPKEFIDMLIKEYNTTNISIKELSAKYHTDVYYHFKKNGIKKGQKENKWHYLEQTVLNIIGIFLL